ncbi:MAG: sugar transferase [Chloroflexi bacterium]|nr:sugar transferase [Chloroflexota bacterium]
MLRRYGVNYAIFSLAVDACVIWLASELADMWRPSLTWLPMSKLIPQGERIDPMVLVAVTVVWVIVFLLFSLYDPQVTYKVSDEVRLLLTGSGFAGLASAGLAYLSFRDVSRWMFLLQIFLALIFLFVWRMVARLLIKVTFKQAATVKRRVIIVGSSPIGQHVGQMIDAHQGAGLILVGYLTDKPLTEIEGRPVLGAVSNIRTVVQENKIDDVIVAQLQSESRLRAVVSDLLDIPVHVRVIPDCYALALDRPVIDGFAGVPMVDLRGGPLSHYQRVVKRIFDLAVSFILILITLPIMAIIFLAIKLDSAGPVLFKQVRIGENGKPFIIYKFRSMVRYAENQMEQVLVQDGGNVIHKQPDDPRVTRVGRFLRRTSLDELPQLFNVLKGNMSLVGPRPELPWLAAQYEPWQRRRLVVPQGLTGWWQVNGRSSKPMHLHTDVDIYYIANYSFWLDLRILWKTLWVVLQGKGAH